MRNERILAFEAAEASERGLAKLAKLVERDLEDRVAAERLLATVWQRDSTVPLSPALS